MNVLKSRFATGLAFATASAVLVAVAVPASASNAARPDPAAETAVMGGPAPAPVAAAVRKPQRYCFLFNITGSMIERKICKTKQEWADQGIDVTAVAK